MHPATIHKAIGVWTTPAPHLSSAPASLQPHRRVGGRLVSLATNHVVPVKVKQNLPQGRRSSQIRNTSGNSRSLGNLDFALSFGRLSTPLVQSSASHLAKPPARQLATVASSGTWSSPRLVEKRLCAGSRTSKKHVPSTSWHAFEGWHFVPCTFFSSE